MTRRAAWILAVGMALLPMSTFAAQTAPAFEVASIKPAPPLSRELVQAGKLHMGINVSGSRADFGYLSLADLLAYAYRVKSHQIAGPDWIRESRWDILAKIPEGESPERAPEMLQTLLQERFKLSVHRENREHPVYELVVAKTGSKLKPSDPEEEKAADAAGDKLAVPGIFLGGGANAGTSTVRVNNDGKGMVVSGSPNGTMRMSMSPNGGMRLEMSKVSMTSFADMLTPFTDRTVVDRTELKGNYQVALDLPLEALMAMVQNSARANGMANLVGGNPFGGRQGGLGGVPGIAGASDPTGASIVQAVQELGLRLEARKAPVETIVVDHVEKVPTEN